MIKSARKNGDTATRVQRLNEKAAKLHHAGKLDEAQRYYLQALTLAPHDFDAQHLLGLLHYHKGDALAATALIAQALLQRPIDPFAHNNLGNAFDALGKTDEAIAAYRKALQLLPDYAEAYNNLGGALKSKGGIDDAISCFEKALELSPDYVDARHNLGVVLHGQGRFIEAEACFRAVLLRAPQHAPSYFHLGLIYSARKNYGDAISHYLRALEYRPDDSEACFHLAYALSAQGKRLEAAGHYQKAIQLNPGYTSAHYNLGCVLYVLGRPRDALTCYQRALALKPNLPEAYYNLGIALHDLEELDVAARCYRQAIALRPDYVEAYNNLGKTLKWQGKIDEAVASYRQALALREDPDVNSNLIGTMMYSNTSNADDVFAESLKFAERFEGPLKPYWRPHANMVSDKRLKIGYVSGDFRRHSVAYFIEPVLACHDKASFDIYCYHNHKDHDDYSARFAAIADHWIECADMTDAELAERVRSDGIQILVDLSGHTGHNRLVAFAHKPAPVQITWIGLPASTGLTAMDYRITDEFLDPTGVAERYHTEKLLRLPIGAPYQPPENCPVPNALPARESGYFTFACFNNPGKLNDENIALWALILERVPEARIMFGNMDSKEIQEGLARKFEQRGIAPSRLIMYSKMSLVSYMTLHHHVDAALDPFPYNGGTTTTHSLWMGVPVVVLEGHIGVSRVGSAIMNRIGLPEFVARTREEYVEIAVGLTRNLDSLGKLRQTLRERVVSNMQHDPAAITSNVENMYRTIWNTWCEQQHIQGAIATES